MPAKRTKRRRAPAGTAPGSEAEMARGSWPMQAGIEKEVDQYKKKEKIGVNKRLFELTEEGDGEDDVLDTLVGPVRVPRVDENGNGVASVRESSDTVGLDRGLETDAGDDGGEQSRRAGDWR